MLDPFDFWMVKKWPEDALEWIVKYHTWAMSIAYTDEIVYSDRQYFDIYENKDILVVGGGPSFNKFIENKSLFYSYDYIWSCNHFFLNKYLLEQRIDLAMIMPGVDLDNEDLNLKIKLDDTLIGIELHDKWCNNPKLNEFQKKYKDQMFLSHTRFFGKLGIGARMMILAASLEAGTISFIGFDGPIEGHSFQLGKNELPAGVTQENAIQVYEYQYNILWDYLAKNFPATEIISLDKTNPLHKKVWHL